MRTSARKSAGGGGPRPQGRKARAAKSGLSRAWVVTADMGLGHQRAAWPLRDMAEDGIMTLGRESNTDPAEHKQWQRLRRSYEFLSRAKSWPIIGNTILRAAGSAAWEPCLKTEGWAHLTVVARSPSQKTVEAAARDALTFALQLRRDPSAVEMEDYRVGPAAYENWISCVGHGMGTSHGHWWNGMVWSECRQQAAAFFQEMAEVLDSPRAQETCAELQKVYADIGGALSAAKEKNVEQAEQLRLLKLARDAEAGAAPKLEALMAAV